MPSLLTYAPSMARRKANYAAFVAKTWAIDPKSAAGLQATFAKTDVVATAVRRATVLGFRANSASDAYALWWVVAYSAAQGHEVPEDRALLAAVRAQAAQAFGSAHGAAGASDATKQRLAEACIVQAVLIDEAMDRAKGKPNALRALAQTATKGARTLGVDLNALTLTVKGFVAR